jgi:non-lysosomal glucosylceramidase
MTNYCRCSGGRCNVKPLPINRRDFLERLAVGAAALAVGGQMTWADQVDALVPPLPSRSEWFKRYPIASPRVYRGKNLEAVGMPLGGIGTGSIWLDGQGRLGIWQIFNNLSESRVPDSFFAVRAKTTAGPAVTRVLQTQGEGRLRPVESIDYEGGYPIARLTFHDAELPVQVALEALNPMIPLDTANSSIPCVLVRLTAKNSGAGPVEVDLCASLQNAVGNAGAGGQGVRLGGYGGNRNRIVSGKKITMVTMDKAPDPMTTGPVKVRTAAGKEVAGPALTWVAGLGELTAQSSEPLARTAAQGGAVLADGVSAAFFITLAKLRQSYGKFGDIAEVFDEFEGKTYQGWTITGNAFGKGPSHGTEPGQQQVSGFSGHGLINTFVAGDGPQGTAKSRPFRIRRRYIGFLIGGGAQAGQACINLRVDGKVVRTATGKNEEVLSPASWDVGDLMGRDAVLEIVDQSSAVWGHINIDRIIFSDIPPEPLLARGTAPELVAKTLGRSFTSAEETVLPHDSRLAVTADMPDAAKAAVAAWKVDRYTRLAGFRAGEHGYQALVTTPDGDPLVIQGPLGKGRVILALAPALPWSVGSELLAAQRGEPLKSGERLVPGNPVWGTMTLGAFDDRAVALPGWATADQIAAFLSAAKARPASTEAVSKPGETVNAAVAVPLTLAPGESRSVTFAITWHFPNVQRFHHSGNLYSRRWPDAAAVAGYLAENLDALWQRTELYHATLYQSNLPEEFLDAMASQSVILRGPTCFWSEDGYFGGFEGSYGCCPLNCTHVWGYAQSHARLFPDVGQNMRISNFITYLYPSGETSYREHVPLPGWIDGHCACIEAAYREYQLSPDRQFLEKIWPGVKKAMDWLIRTIDPGCEGMTHGHQWNTYDSAVSGANTFIGSHYLAALAASERMALVMQDSDSAGRWRAVRLSGMKNQDEKLWNGEYYIQIPAPKPAQDYNTGCHADQLLGQWWAHMLNLGYLYPKDRVRSAFESIMKYNFREKFAGFQQKPRRYIPDDEGGLIICTWPHGGRPKDFTVYSDEVWTGIEYAAAGTMIYEGLVDNARRIVRMARSRYDGRRRDGLDSGPGGNPFNELECGKFYARAMSSWSLLIASQGLVLEGPKGLLGFKPNWQPEDHRSLFTAPEGWGLFIQQRKDKEQTERIEVRHGRLRLKELVFALPDGVAATATVKIAGQTVPATLAQSGKEVRLALGQEVIVAEGEAVEVSFPWNGS